MDKKSREHNDQRYQDLAQEPPGHQQYVDVIDNNFYTHTSESDNVDSFHGDLSFPEQAEEQGNRTMQEPTGLRQREAAKEQSNIQMGSVTPAKSDVTSGDQPSRERLLRMNDKVADVAPSLKMPKKDKSRLQLPPDDNYNSNVPLIGKTVDPDPVPSTKLNKVALKKTDSLNQSQKGVQFADEVKRKEEQRQRIMKEQNVMLNKNLKMELSGSSQARPSVKPMKTKKRVKDQSMDLSIVKEYKSRRQRGYDDSNSEDEEYIQTEGNQSHDTGNIEYSDTKGNVTSLKPNLRFLPYKNVFKDLLKQTNVITMYPIISMLITYDSTRALTVTKKDDRFYYIKMYDLEQYDLKFEECIGGGKDSYIKFKEVEQNHNGSEFAALYNDDGTWFLRTFGKETRTQQEIMDNEININAIIGIDNNTMCNEMFPEPFGTCCFVNQDKIFVDVFYNYARTHYHLMINIRERKVVGEIQSSVIKCNLKNFPYKCFYSDTRDEVYSFYRQGQAFCVDANDVSKFKMEQIIEKDLGQMVMFAGECLIVRSSGSIYFFKQIVDKMTKIESWKLFHTIKVRGFIFYIKGNIRIQITTDELIYFYLIDKETFMPELENVMYNYMGCNQMMFGSKVRYGITYKTNQRSFDIYRRKFMHNLKVTVANDNMEGAFGLSLPKLNCFLVCQIDKIKIFHAETFQQIGMIPIKLLPTETREPNEIIGITKSKCEKWLAVVSGKHLIMQKQAQNQLFIFKLNERCEEGEVLFDQVDRIVVKEMPHFQNVCMQFYFKDFEGPEPHEMFFCKSTELFTLNIKKREFNTVHKFRPALLTQPQYYYMSSNQMVHVLASVNDGIWYNYEDDKEIDLDELYNIDLIKCITYDEEDKSFYFLCNKKKELLGFYLFKFREINPLKYEEITVWNSRLDIDNCAINILRGHDQVTKEYFKELVVAYKTIYINTYNVVVFDIPTDKDKEKSTEPDKSSTSRGMQNTKTLYIHESFQLWESTISGIMLEKNKDFISISKVGINLLALGAIPKRHVLDGAGQDKMIHNLDSSSFLKIDKINFIKYECQDYNNRVISVEQEYELGVPGTDSYETKFYSVYKIKISEVTLRELLILQSFYLCGTQADIVNLVKLQPKPKFFYKCFLELDLATMTSILAFDSGSMEALLNDENQEYFDEKYPIIYKNKIPKKQGHDFYYRSAIITALRNNQIQSVNLLIDYIVKYQNNYVSSSLFMKTLPILLEKGVSVVSLFNSNVFCFSFDYDEWPSNHRNDEECIRPYCESIFMLRQNYASVFPEPEFAPVDEFSQPKDSAQPDTMKVYKIKFQINLLPSVGEYYQKDPADPNKMICHNERVNFMDLIAGSDEIEIFDSQQIMDLIQFKWEAYGRNHHIFGSLMHFLYVLLFILYVNFVYLYHDSGANHVISTVILALGIIYPWMYDLTQLIKDGPTVYFQDPWNYVDFVYIYGSIANIVLQLVLDPFHIYIKILLSVIIVILVMKTFFFLRILQNFTPIVIMLTNVIYDLRIFGLFYSILCFLFSLMFNVIGVGLEQVQCLVVEGENQCEIQDSRRLLQQQHMGTPQHNRILVVRAAGGPDDDADAADTKIPDEYKYLGMFVGQFFSALRLSIGDFECIDTATNLPKYENWIFWVIWLLAVIISNVVFLNFIVAEASASYSNVTETLEAVIQKEKASMISESEAMSRQASKKDSEYPPYIIIRSIET